VPGPCKPPILEDDVTGHFTSYKHRTDHELATQQDGRSCEGALRTLDCV
jgi:hypothetical protein